MITKHTSRFMMDNPQLKMVAESPYEDMLIWADQEKYYILQKFEGQKYYTEQQLQMAKMWSEKEGKTFELKRFALYVVKGENTSFVRRFKTEEEATEFAVDLMAEDTAIEKFTIEKYQEE